jgi:6,7-dimethyl-8-ribityllumazine synthase
LKKIKIEHPVAPSRKSVEGSLSAAGHSFGIVVSRFNSFITERLLASAIDALRRTGAKDTDVHIVRVPGAFEIPSAARSLAATGEVEAIICLGCLLRGETSNYEHITEEVTRGVGQSAEDTGVPHAWGVLTCDTLEQAIDRAGLKSGNKGFEAALAAVEMASLGRTLQQKAVSAQRSALTPSRKVASRRLPVPSKSKASKPRTKKRRNK